jgi:hypothetical protein
MSVTSATETFTDGAELFDQEKYQSTVTSSFEPDPIQMEQNFKRPLSERITPIHSHSRGLYGEYRLDDVIVRCPSEAFRKHQAEQWNTNKKEAEKTRWDWGVTAIGTAFFSGICGAVTVMDKALFSGLPLILCVAGAILSIVSGVFAANANSACNQALTQIDKWEADPVVKVGEARNEAHNKGFPYIYLNKLKLGFGPSTTALFHPLQVEYEYKKYFDAFCRKLLDQTNPTPSYWMNQFRSCNPVSSDYMFYGLGHIPEHMKPVLEDCRRFESFLSDITSSYDKMKSDVRKTASERIEAHTKTRNEALQPLATTRDTGIATAEATRDRVLRDAHASDTRRREARATFSAIKEALQDNYNQNAAPINKKHDAKIKEIEKERDQQIRKLDEQKNGQLDNNYKAARELLERAKHAWDNKGYQPVNFQSYFPYQSSQPFWTQQQPSYYQPPVYQQPVYYPQMQPPAPNYPGYGRFEYGHDAQIPAHQQYSYAPPKATAPSNKRRA